MQIAKGSKDVRMLMSLALNDNLRDNQDVINEMHSRNMKGVSNRLNRLGLRASGFFG